MRHRLLLFVVSCFLGGVGGVLGSIAGNAVGKAGLFVGGIVGGLLGASSTGIVARGRGWIPPHRTWPTGAGAAIGFLAAALVATQTLGSPVGPVLSTSLIGLGALAGAGRKLPFAARFTAGLAGFLLASAALYVTAGILGGRGRRRLVAEGRLPESALHARLPLWGHAWRLGALAAVGAVLCSGIAFIAG